MKDSYLPLPHPLFFIFNKVHPLLLSLDIYASNWYFCRSIHCKGNGYRHPKRDAYIS